jgi:hypothetical protein
MNRDFYSKLAFIGVPKQFCLVEVCKAGFALEASFYTAVAISRLLITIESR